MEQRKEVSVSGVSYAVKRLLGKGKGGYSYLVTDGAGGTQFFINLLQAFSYF